MANSIVDLLRNEKLLVGLSDAEVPRASPAAPAYDVNCQYLINLLKCLLNVVDMLPHLEAIKSIKLPDLRGSVRSFHVRMHKIDCQTKQNPEFLPGFAKKGGDQTEHPCTKHNVDAPMTKEMTTGHRQDRMNDCFSDTDIIKVHDMPRALHEKYQEANRQYCRSCMFLDKSEKSIEPTTLDQWKAEEAVWLAKVVDIKMHNDLDNPFVPDVDESNGDDEAVARTLGKERADSGDTGGMQIVAAIEGMIELETERHIGSLDLLTFDCTKHRKRQQIKKKVDDFLIIPQLSHDIYNRSRTVLAYPYYISNFPCGTCINSPATRQTQMRSPVSPHLPMPFPMLSDVPSTSLAMIQQPLDVQEELVNELVEQVENVTILLPSRYHSKIRKHTSMAQSVTVELHLREEQSPGLTQYREANGEH
ncbi:hypothetical protein C8T65DRAFT_738584 [Cerioporus squamosus]|nr:hypothetical protein C8T65DRAFT_738584 [Cerioporus squamosus]